MQILVEHGFVTVGERQFMCALGREGLTSDKREGDLKTPRGTYPLRYIFYRPDRVTTPVSGLPVVALTPEDGWCDDAVDARYNQHIKLPYAARHEKLWREDGLYDVILVIGYNDDPVVPGKGSAIFMHVRRPDGVGTEGCVALEKADLLALLQRVGPESTITIR